MNQKEMTRKKVFDTNIDLLISVIFCLLIFPYNQILYKYADKEILHNGNLSLEQVIECAKVMRANSNARFFVGTVMEMLGTCVSIGVPLMILIQDTFKS